MLRPINFLLVFSLCLRIKGLSSSDQYGRRPSQSTTSFEASREEDLTDDECFESLQISCDINGYIIPALVDTGAQISVMSESCARRCRVANMIDGRFSGKVVGVGSSDILGRINELPMQVGPISFHNKVSILRESRIDLILGLDFLRRFRTEINLDERILKLKVRNRIIRISLIANHDGPLKKSRGENEYDEEDIIIQEESSSEEDSTCNEDDRYDYLDRKPYDYQNKRSEQIAGYPQEKTEMRKKYESKEKARIPYSKSNDYDDFSFDEESDDDLKKGLFGISMEGV